jgi:hypothetical protein
MGTFLKVMGGAAVLWLLFFLFFPLAAVVWLLALGQWLGL